MNMIGFAPLGKTIRKKDHQRCVYHSWDAQTIKNTEKVIKREKDKRKTEKEKDPAIPYNTVRGGATQPIVGPFTFPDVTVQVYPLASCKDKLKEFVDEYLNDTLDLVGMQFEPWGSQVYLIVSVYDSSKRKMFSDNNNIGNWVEKEVAISIPVKWYEFERDKDGDFIKDEGGTYKKKFVNWGLLSPFLFGNTGRAVISDREINGRPMVKAKIECDKDVWLSPAGPKAQRRLLKLDTEVYPGLFMSQQSEERTLIEIVERREEEKTSDPNEGKHETEDSSSAAEKILEKLPLMINRIHLKQHRDAHNTEDLCYQALVNTSPEHYRNP